jgi:hypothetical protein
MYTSFMYYINQPLLLYRYIYYLRLLYFWYLKCEIRFRCNKHSLKGRLSKSYPLLKTRS